MKTVTLREDFKVSHNEYIPAGTRLQLQQPFSLYNTFQAVKWKEKVLYIHSSFFAEIMENEPIISLRESSNKMTDT